VVKGNLAIRTEGITPWRRLHTTYHLARSIWGRLIRFWTQHTVFPWHLSTSTPISHLSSTILKPFRNCGSTPFCAVRMHHRWKGGSRFHKLICGYEDTHHPNRINNGCTPTRLLWEVWVVSGSEMPSLSKREIPMSHCAWWLVVPVDCLTCCFKQV